MHAKIAKILEEGIGVERDVGLALEYYNKAVAQNHNVAQCSLAILYDTGKGVELDKEKAVQLFELSAQQDNPASQNNLGR